MATLTLDYVSPSELDALSVRVAALEAGGGGAPVPIPGSAERHESTTQLVSRLYVEDKAPYKVAAHIRVPFIKEGKVVLCYAENHVDPRQKRKEGECAIVTGIYVDGIGWVAKAAGQDSYYAQKTQSPRVGSFVAPVDMANVDITLQMRALNKYAGGYANISWVKVGAIVF